jgi:ferric-dicitrate binding protein FerR (iron transport regulator)
MKQDYSTYNTDNFILDNQFREIVNSKNSKNRLNKLLETYPEKKREIELAASIVRELKPESFHQPEERKQELWHQIAGGQKRKIRLTWLGMAASFLLLIGIGSAVFYWMGQNDAGNTLTENGMISDDAVLILDNGESIAISSKESSVAYSADGSEVVVNDASQIARSAPAGGINQLIVPYGKRSFITLSEGTKVWLNSGSKLVFPSVFSGNSREVEVQGEAYFEVAANSEKAFYVKTDFFKIKVYGTKFNVQAYSQDNISNVVLVEGKVGMSPGNEVYTEEVLLSPNQKASIAKGRENFEIATLEDAGIYTAWKDGYLAFNDEEVTDVLKRVSRYYNITIEASLSENVEHIYGKLELKDEVERVLDGVAFISKTRFKKEGEKYIFYE